MQLSNSSCFPTVSFFLKSRPEIPSESTHPALLNDVILRQIFSNLTLLEYMECRMVCSKWKSVNESSFKKKVRINFDFTKRSEITIEPPNDLNDFFKASQQEFPFTALRFNKILPWAVTHLINFFYAEGKFITDLELFNVSLSTDKNNTYDIYTLTNIVGSLQNLERLKISVNEYPVSNYTRFFFTLADLKSIMYLDLEKCTIELTDDIISPITLHLRKITFTLRNIRQKDIVINEFVEFSNLNGLAIVNKVANIDKETTKMRLDLSGSVILDFLELENVVLLNMELSSWEIETLSIKYINFAVSNDMKVENMYINYSRVQLSYVPQTIKILSFGYGTRFFEDTDWNNIIFPNVKCLRLLSKNSLKAVIRHLHMFPQLTKLTLESKEQSAFRINVSRIPDTVKVLILKDENFLFVGDSAPEMNIINLEKVTGLKVAANIAERFSTNRLIVTEYVLGEHEYGYASYLQYLLESTIPRISLGKLPKKYVRLLADQFSLVVMNGHKYILSGKAGTRISFTAPATFET